LTGHVAGRGVLIATRYVAPVLDRVFRHSPR